MWYRIYKNPFHKTSAGQRPWTIYDENKNIHSVDHIDILVSGETEENFVIHGIPRFVLKYNAVLEIRNNKAIFHPLPKEVG